MGRRLAFGMAVMLGSSALGCGPDVSDFEGLWAAHKSNGGNSCTGPYTETSDNPFTMRLRAGQDSDLEYVSLDQEDLTRETCVQTFSVDGDTATMIGEQDCSQPSQQVDEQTGDLIETVLVTTYTRDELVLDGDSLHESVSWKIGDDADCIDSLEIDFKRLE
jgi:hypothetical protein